jgi:hypothetical protein
MHDLQKVLSGLSDSIFAPGRRFVMEGSVMKVSRKKHHKRCLFLFSDLLIYASPTGLREETFVVHRQYDLEKCRVVGVDGAGGEGGVGRYAFQIISQEKSFEVYCGT